MNARLTQLAAFTCIGGIVAGLSSGCVASSTYEQAQKTAERQLLNEQRLAQDLAAGNRQMKQRIGELESTLRSMQEQLALTDKDWKDTRDELLRMKIDKEQRPRERDRISRSDKPGTEADDRLSQGRSDETMRRVKDLLQQIQRLLQQYQSVPGASS